MHPIHIITLGTRDLDRAKTFYQNTFQFPVHDMSNENIIFFDMTGMLLALYPWEALAEDATISSDTSGFRGVTLAHNTKEKTDVDTFIQKACDNSATLVKAAQDVFWGGYSGYISCPDGHLWEIAWNPFLQFNEEGKLT